MAKILLVEPDRLMAKTYMSALQQAGHTTQWATDAQTAILAADDAPDVIVIELQLVTHNGIELLYELGSYVDLQKVPVIIQSFVAEVEFLLSPVSKTFNIAGYLHKPTTSLEKLIQTCEKSLRVTA